MRISDWSSDVCSSDLSGRASSAFPTSPDAARFWAFTPARCRWPKMSIWMSWRESPTAMSGPIWPPSPARRGSRRRSEEHTSELQSLMRISYAVFCLKKKKQTLHGEHLYIQTYTEPHTHKSKPHTKQKCQHLTTV